MIIRDILRANPKLEFYKDVFVLTNKNKKLKQIEFQLVFILVLQQALWKLIKEIFLMLH